MISEGARRQRTGLETLNSCTAFISRVTIHRLSPCYSDIVSSLQFPALDQRHHPAWVNDFGEVSEVRYKQIWFFGSCKMASTVMLPPENNITGYSA